VNLICMMCSYQDSRCRRGGGVADCLTHALYSVRMMRTRQAKKYTRQNRGALPGKCTRSAFGYGLAGAPIGPLAGKAGGVGAVSEFALRFYTA